MRHLIRWLLLPAGVGALLTLIVAVGCVIWVRGPADPAPYRASWPSVPPADWPRDCEIRYLSKAFGSSRVAGANSDQVRGGRKGLLYAQETYRAGWPFTALEVVYTEIVDYSAPLVAYYSVPANLASPVPSWIPLRDPSQLKRIPLRAAWIGFASNTAIYASLFIAGTFVVGQVRRRVRRAGGLCAACGHQLGGSTACPECGSARARVLHSGA